MSRTDFEWNPRFDAVGALRWEFTTGAHLTRFDHWTQLIRVKVHSGNLCPDRLSPDRCCAVPSLLNYVVLADVARVVTDPAKSGCCSC